MTFETERCEHGMPWLAPCPACIMDAMERVKQEREKARQREGVRDLVTDDLRPFKGHKKGDLPGDMD